MSEALTVAEVIEKNGYAIRPFRGISMMPLLVQEKDAVRLIHPEGRLKKYDIALFQRQNGDLVLHRVVKVLSDRYLIRGDNCLRSECVSDRQIIAVADGIYKSGTFHDVTEKSIRRFAVRQKITLPFRFAYQHTRALAHRTLRYIFKRK